MSKVEVQVLNACLLEMWVGTLDPEMTRDVMCRSRADESRVHGSASDEIVNSIPGSVGWSTNWGAEIVVLEVVVVPWSCELRVRPWAAVAVPVNRI